MNREPSSAQPNRTATMDSPRRVLVMDGDINHCYIYQRALNHIGYEVHLATNLPEVHHLLTRYGFAVFITDVETALRNNELDLLAIACNSLSKNGASIIMIADESRHHHLSKSMGADSLINKPIRVRPLIDLVKCLAPLL